MVFNQIGPSTRPPPPHIVSSHGPESVQLFHTTYMYILELTCNKAPPLFFAKQIGRHCFISKKYMAVKMPVISLKISKNCFVSIFFNEGKSINGKIFTHFLSLVSELMQEKYVQILTNRQKVKSFWKWEIVQIQCKFRQ